MALFAGCLVVLGGGIAVPSAQAVQYGASVVFTSVVADAEGVTLSGTVTNTGTDPLYKAQVILWRDSDTINTPQALQAVMALDPQADTGDRMLTKAADSVIVSGNNTFQPGQTADFTVTASWAGMGITADGAYLVGVHVRASSVSWGTLVTVGRGRTLVTLAQTKTASSAVVVMLTSAPSLIHDNVFLDDHLASELTGRLSTLLKLAQQPGVTWAIDPALYNEISVMAKGYQVMQGTDLVAGTGQAAASQWLAAFRSLNQANGYRLPWGNPDLALGLATSNADLITTSQAAEAANPQLDKLPLLVRPGNGLADDAFLSYIAPLQPTVVLAQAGADATLAHGVLLDTMPTAFPAGIGPAGDDAVVQQEQMTWVDDLVSPDPVIRVIDTAADADLASQTMPSWVNLVPLSSIPTTTSWTTELSTGQAAGPLTTSMTGPLASVQTAVASYSSLVADPKATAAQMDQTQVAILSQSWSDDTAATQYATAVGQWLTSILDDVTLSAAPDVTLTSRTSSFPVTVSNGLSVPVYIRITAQSVPDDSSPATLTIPATEVVTVKPADKLSLTVTPTVVREGDADIVLQLTTQDGLAFNPPVTVHVHANISAWMGWIVVGSAFVLFVVGTVLRVKTKSAHLRRPHAQEAT